MARDDRPSDDEPRRPGRLFWICALVLIMAVVWTALSAVLDSEGIRTLIAIVVGVGFVFLWRDRIWGEDWRERVAAEREKAKKRR